MQGSFLTIIKNHKNNYIQYLIKLENNKKKDIIYFSEIIFLF